MSCSRCALAFLQRLPGWARRDSSDLTVPTRAERSASSWIGVALLARALRGLGERRSRMILGMHALFCMTLYAWRWSAI